MKHLIMVPLLAVVLLAVAACGGGGGAKKTPAAGTPGSQTAIVVTPAVDRRGVETPTAGESTVVATQFALENYHHDAKPLRQGSDVIDFPYDVLLPKGWHIDTAGVGITASLPKPDNFPYLTVSIDCRPFSGDFTDKSLMIKKDSTAADNLSLGNLSTQPRASITVGGRDAVRIDWNGSGTFRADHISVYVNGEDCAWRLQLNAFGAIRPDQVSALFERIIEKFNPAQGLK